MKTTMTRPADLQILQKRKPKDKTSNIIRIARSLADLYQTHVGTPEAFARIYRKRALQLSGTERRKLHREFRRLM